MSFECCATCGHVERRPRAPTPFGRPAGRCPECGRTTYWTATPFAQIVLSRWKGGAGAPSAETRRSASRSH